MTGAIAAIAFVIVLLISQMITGEYKPLHEYLGLPLGMNEIGVKAGGAYLGFNYVI